MGRVPQRLGDAAGSVTVLTRDDIEQSAARTLDDFLRQVPGFSLFRRSSSLVAHPTTQGVSLRGIAPSGVSRTLVLVDGVPRNDAFGGWVYWSRIPLESVERVEILRGGGAGAWGNYSTGGVINIVTRDVESRGIAGAVLVGGQDDFEVDLGGGQSLERLRWFAGVNLLRADGYPVVREDQRGAIDVRATSQHESANAKIGYDLSPRARLSLTADYFDEDRGNGTPLTQNGTETAALSARVGLTTTGGSTWEFILFAQDQEFNATFSAQAPDRESESPALDQFAVDSSDLGGSVQWTRSLGEEHLLSVGSDLRGINGESNENFLWDGQAFLRQRRAGGELRLAGIFVQDLWALGSRLQLSLSARVDYWRSSDGSRLELDRADGSILRFDRFEDRDDVELGPTLAIIHKTTRRLSVRASGYRSFRTPTVNELYRPFRVGNDITSANAELHAETLTGAEFGASWSSRRVFGRTTLFWNRIDDPIANVTIASVTTPGQVAPCGFVPAGGSCRQRQNLGESRVRGLEAELVVRPNEHWKVSTGYLLSDGEIVSAPAQPALEGKRIAQAAEHQLTFLLGYDNPKLLGAGVQARYIGDQFEDDLNRRELEGFVVVDLSVRKTIGPKFQLFLGVENLFDAVYEVGKSANGLVTVGSPTLVHGGVRMRLTGNRGSDR